MRKIKQRNYYLASLNKAVSILLILLLTFSHFSPMVVLASEMEGGEQEETQQTEQVPEPEPELETTVESEVLPDSPSSPSPSPTPGTEVDNDAEVTNDVDSTAISGENTINQPSPSPSPTPDATPAGESDEPLCQVEVEDDCPDEPEVMPEVSPDPTPLPIDEPIPAEVDTGDAVSVTEVENSVNTTEVDTQVLFQTLNIFVPGDIDLATSPLAIAENVFGQDSNNEAVVNVTVTEVNNIAYLSNDIVSFANSGNNTVEGAQEAVINTDDAYSIVSLLNKVNTTIIGSTIHIVTINIFGAIQGNILLPELSSEIEDSGYSGTTQIESKTVVENDVDSTAISGQNAITNADGASINTGSAVSAVNVINVVNTSLIRVVFHRLIINTLGTWIGSFLGWDDFEAANGGGSLSLNSTNTEGNGEDSCSSCSGDISIGNEARVVNNISSTANTGGNSVEASEASIDTGDAHSVVSLVNFVNSSIIDSFGFLGFINIFDQLNGDIGGTSLFASQEPEAEPQVEEEDTSEQGEPGPSIREAGGELDIYQYNNVGTHVLPGDTVTFFVTVRNPGTGRVYDVVLDLGLIKDGEDVGGGIFELGDIKQGEGVKVTTGMVLSEDSEPGDYLAHAVVTGYVGPDNELISAYSDSFFKIVGLSPLPLMPGTVQEVGAADYEGEVLAGAIVSQGLTLEEKLRFLLVGLIAAYLVTKGFEKRKKLALIFSRHQGLFSLKSRNIRSFLARLSSFLS